MLDQDEDGLIGPEELMVALSSIGWHFSNTRSTRWTGLRPDATEIDELMREVSQGGGGGEIPGIHKDAFEKFLERHLTVSVGLAVPVEALLVSEFCPCCTASGCGDRVEDWISTP